MRLKNKIFSFVLVLLIFHVSIASAEMLSQGGVSAEAGTITQLTIFVPQEVMWETYKTNLSLFGDEMESCNKFFLSKPDAAWDDLPCINVNELDEAQSLIIEKKLGLDIYGIKLREHFNYNSEMEFIIDDNPITKECSVLRLKDSEGNIIFNQIIYYDFSNDELVFSSESFSEGEAQIKMLIPTYSPENFDDYYLYAEVI